MVSEWNQWLVPAPMRIMQRPRDFVGGVGELAGDLHRQAGRDGGRASAQAGVPGAAASS